MPHVTAEDLDATFGQQDTVRFEAGPHRLIRIVVTAPAGDAHVYLHGGHVTHFQPRGERPVLFTSCRAAFAPGKAIRGGIPVIFPWFGPRAGRPSDRAHGFARFAEWTVEEVEGPHANGVTVVLGLEATDATRRIWPHDFRLRYTVTVGSALDLALEVENTGVETFTFEEALHTYLAVTDVREVTVTGLENTSYIDKTDAMRRKRQGNEPLRIIGETDRVHVSSPGPCVVDDPAGGRRVIVDKDGSATTVVWNPWIDKAMTMPDFDPDEWRSMLCVETANTADDAVTLSAGRGHRMHASIRTEGRRAA